MEPISRRDVPVELTWDLSSIYATEEEMFADMEKLKNLSDRIVRDYKGKLNTAQTINACLDDLREVYRLNILTGSYCNLRQGRFLRWRGIHSGHFCFLPCLTAAGSKAQQQQQARQTCGGF